MDTLRTPFLVLAIILMALIVLLELGSGLLIPSDGVAASRLTEQTNSFDEDVDLDPDDLEDLEEPPGRAIWSMAFVDGLVLYSVALMGIALLIPDRLHGRLQGIVTLILSILMILAAIIYLILILIELIVMVSLFMAPPFGTIAYLVVWGFFDRGDAATVLGLLLFLKLCFGGCLLLAHQRFLQQKGLMLLLLTSLVLNIVVAFLHGLVPIILVSITDRISALLILIVGIIWALVFLVGSIVAIVKALQSSTSAR